ncbi:unannotated protein [freshwater metagenome]|uniref:Unannotated protein n=1 Tax=freshwater metagenome TaxID=449393 RepID=A0A6J6PY59_9ZZZZ
MLTRGLVGSVLVLLGGLVISTLPVSTALLDSRTLVLLREAEAGRMIALSVVLVGLGLLASAWLALCRHVAVVGGPRDDAVGLVRHAVVVWSAPLVVAPPLFSRDGWSYAAQGMLAHLGISPYEHGPAVLTGPVVQAVDPMWMHTVTPYGPLPVAYGAAVAAHTGNPWVLAIAHRGLAILGLVLIAWAVPRLARWSRVDPALASALVLASPLMLGTGIGGLHNDVLMVGLMAVALVVAGEHSWVLGAALGGAAAAVKVPGGVICVGVALVGLPVAASLADRLRRLGAVGLVSVGTLLGTGVVTGLGQGWLPALMVPGDVRGPLSITTLAGGLLDDVAGVLGAGLAPATFLGLVRGLGLLVIAGVAGWVALRRPTGSRPSALASVALVVATMVVLSPVVHVWYLLWLPPFVAVLRLPPLGTWGLVGASTVFGLVAPLDSSLHGAYTAIALGSVLVALLVPVLLLTTGARRRLDRIALSPARVTR